MSQRNRNNRRAGERIDYQNEVFGFPKGETSKARRDREQKHERQVKIEVRRVVFNRDPGCVVPEDPRWPHDGPDEWAHLEDAKRWRTVCQRPEERHTARLSARLCRGHHQGYDDARAGTLALRFLSDRGADGPIEWTVGGELVGGGTDGGL